MGPLNLVLSQLLFAAFSCFATGNSRSVTFWPKRFLPRTYRASSTVCIQGTGFTNRFSAVSSISSLFSHFSHFQPFSAIFSHFIASGLPDT
jgi:hypothetical protein